MIARCNETVTSGALSGGDVATRSKPRGLGEKKEQRRTPEQTRTGHIFYAFGALQMARAAAA